MRVEFVLRTPGQHRTYFTEEMDVVPREGEAITLDAAVSGVVHSVTWDIPARRAIVLVRE